MVNILSIIMYKQIADKFGQKYETCQILEVGMKSSQRKKKLCKSTQTLLGQNYHLLKEKKKALAFERFQTFVRRNFWAEICKKRGSLFCKKKTTQFQSNQTGIGLKKLKKGELFLF